ncbi:MAG: DUF6869 domain-containing protein [Pseudomonadota bacterium]
MGRSEKFDSELSRTLARDDIETLRRLVACYHSRNIEAADYNIVVESAQNDPELALAISVLASAEYDDAEFLAFVAAGPMEELLQTNNKKMVERIVREARKFARFRWMLSGVWLHAIHKENADPIRSAVGGISLDRDPLPPRPSA